MTPELLKAEIVRRIKNASLIVVPEVKHLLPLEAPEKIADLIRRHCENRADDQQSSEKNKLGESKFYDETGKRTINRKTAIG